MLPSNPKEIRREALKAAFPYTIPIMAGFLFLGMTYGIYSSTSGFGVIYPVATSLTVFAGSMEFVSVSLLMGTFEPVQALLMTLMINARHLFYGISMLDKFKGAGKKKFYLIFGNCDESFSINYTADIPIGVDRAWFMFFVTLLDQIYWVTGVSVGAIFGSIINFSTEGLDFVMIAMFVVIFLEQLLKEDDHSSSLIGLGLSVLALVIFGPDKFIIPAMAAILAVLTLLRKPLEKEELK